MIDKARVIWYLMWSLLRASKWTDSTVQIHLNPQCEPNHRNQPGPLTSCLRRAARAVAFPLHAYIHLEVFDE